MNRREWFLLVLLVSLSCGGTYREQLFAVLNNGGAEPLGTGTFHSDSTDTGSGSLWQIDWSEEVVFSRKLSYSDSRSENRSYEMRMGKGGQIFSFRSPGFGEAIPPQYRPSFDESGSNITDPETGDPVLSHHGNWAAWNDEVWQLVGSDQNDSVAGEVITQNIHQAGSYMNNYAHRKSDLTAKPFYSPILQWFYDAPTRSYSSVYWGQSENPAYVYDAPYECDNCFEDLFRPSVLYFQRHTDLGDGVIQVDFLIYNFHRTRAIDFWNVPFLGIRNSSLPYMIVSNSTSDGSSYHILNSKSGHPDGSGGFLPEFSEGAVVRVSGNGAVSSGWFAFSTAPDGNGPTLAFVTAKESGTPENGYGDIRYGTAMNNPQRDVTIASRRALGGSADPSTGLKPWALVNGESIRSRYFILLGDNIDSVVYTVKQRQLTAHAVLEKTSISKSEGAEIHFGFTPTENGTFTPVETTKESAEISLNSVPFSGSYPVFMISTDSQTVLTSDPYHFSLKPYDGTVSSIELLGFCDSEQYKSVTGSTAVSSPKTDTASFGITKIAEEITLSNVKQPSGTFIVVNSKGQRLHAAVRHNTTTGTASVDISQLAPGIYFLKVGREVVHFLKR